MLEFIMMWTAGLLVWANMFIWGFVFVLVALNLLIPAVIAVYGFTVGVIEGIRGR
jgi:hypothetical protein